MTKSPSESSLSKKSSAFDLKQVTKIPLMMIGDWELDAGSAKLTNQQGEQRHLTPKTLQVLLVLLGSPGSTVSRIELLATVWGETYPSDYVVSRAIADLRQALGEEAKSSRYIETIPKIGYRLIAKTGEKKQTQAAPAFNWLIPASAIVAAVVILMLILRTDQDVNPWPLPDPVTSQLGLEHQPRISSDGDWLLYSYLASDSKDWDIYRQSLSGGSPQALADTDAIEVGAALSPDADEFAFVHIESGKCHVVVQKLRQQAPQQLVKCTTKFPTSVDWSPQGDVIAFTASVQDDPLGLRSLHLFDLATQSARPLTSGLPKTGTDYYPRFSPDGRSVAFLRGIPKPDHRAHIWWVDIETGKQKQLTKNDALTGGLSWIDHQTLIYVIREGGRLVTKKLDMKRGVSTTLPLRDLFQPEYHSQSKTLAMVSVRNATDLLLLNLKNKQSRFIAESTFTDRQGVISPDGRWLAFVSTRTGNNQVWLAAVDNDSLRQISDLGQVEIRGLHWRDDSEQLIFAVSDLDHRRLYRTNIISGNTEIIETDGMQASSAHWLTGTNDLVFNCLDQSKWKLCIKFDADGTSKAISDSDAYNPMVDQVSGLIHFTRDKPGLWAIDLESREVSLVWADLPRYQSPGWVVHANQLYYLSSLPVENIAIIEKRDLSTGTTEEIYRGPIPGFTTTLSIDQAGETLVFPSWRSAHDDLIMFSPVNPN